MKKIFFITSLLLIIGVILPSCSLKKKVAELEQKVTALTSDDDADGVLNITDKEATTPAESKVYGDGTSIDSDKDSIPDYMDEEPYSPAKASVDELGKAIDADNDGVPDAIDREPGTQANAIVNFQGITVAFKDADGKSIIASNSQSSSSSSSSSISGGASCNYSNLVFFDLNSVEIKKSEMWKLIDLALKLKLNPNAKANLIGFCDKIGTDEYNLRLSLQRAESIAKFMVDYLNIDEKKFIVSAKGKSDPLVAKKVEEYNRRVEIMLTE